MRGLYAIADTGSLRARGITPLHFAGAVLPVRPAALQLRAKEDSPEEMLAILRALAPLCRGAGVPLVCNDRPDLAVAAGCDMVHLGQDDAPVEAARAEYPNLRAGLSTHDLGQLARALNMKPAYVAYGPVFATRTKRNPDAVVGLDGLRAASELARAHGIPLVAIGGITLETAPEVARWADCAAVIADIFPKDALSAEGLRARAAAFHAALGGT